MKRLILALLIILISCSSENKSDDNDEYSKILINDALPTLNLTLSDGRVITNAELIGKISIIILFSITCPDCKNQLPIVEQLYNDIKDDENIVLFGISRAQGQDEVGEYWQENDLTFPYSPQENSEVYDQFAKAIVPRIYIADKSMIVKFISTDNPLATYNDLMAVIQSID